MEIMIKVLLEKKKDVACWCDASGLTPLLKAASLNPAYNLEVIEDIICNCPQSVELSDNLGKNLLHHLVNRVTDKKRGEDLLRIYELRYLVNQQDEKGNTPLLTAIINNDIIMAELLKSKGGNLFINNKDGHNAATLIQQTGIFKV
ncbi:Protein ACCELERATED CELL DEATH 6 [Bienertia sinuspersici]